jgi:hypothetical protein
MILDRLDKTTILYFQVFFRQLNVQSTAHQTIHFGLGTYRLYFKGISTIIELQLYSVTCCWPYVAKSVNAA